MNPQELEQILDILQERGGWAWEAAMRQVYVNGFAWIVVAVLIFTAAGAVLWFTREDYDRVPSFGFAAFLTGLGIFILLGPPLGMVANPEYHALEMLLP